MQLLVLAGGFGSRLRSVVSSVPKPLAPINGRPFLSFQMENWVSQGATDFIFLYRHIFGYASVPPQGVERVFTLFVICL